MSARKLLYHYKRSEAVYCVYNDGEYQINHRPTGQGRGADSQEKEKFYPA
jgi:hypothetical protein